MISSKALRKLGSVEWITLGPLPSVATPMYVVSFTTTGRLNVNGLGHIATMVTTRQITVARGESQKPPTPSRPGPCDAAPANSSELFALDEHWQRRVDLNRQQVNGSRRTYRDAGVGRQVLVTGGYRKQTFYANCSIAVVFFSGRELHSPETCMALVTMPKGIYSNCAQIRFLGSEGDAS